MKRNSKNESIDVYLCIIASFVRISLEHQAANAYDERTWLVWDSLIMDSLASVKNISQACQT